MTDAELFYLHHVLILKGRPMNRVLPLFLLTVICGSLLGCGGDSAAPSKPSSSAKPDSGEQGSGTKEADGSGAKPSGSGSRP